LETDIRLEPGWRCREHELGVGIVGEPPEHDVPDLRINGSTGRPYAWGGAHESARALVAVEQLAGERISAG
jgi:hypothetical protein